MNRTVFLYRQFRGDGSDGLIRLRNMQMKRSRIPFFRNRPPKDLWRKTFSGYFVI